jgi:hypothetical protein
VRALVEGAGRVLLGGLNPGVRLLYRRLGYADRGSVSFYLRVMDPDAVLASVPMPAAARWIGSLGLGVPAAARRRRRPDLGVTRTAGFDGRFDAWWSTIERALAPVVHRDAAVMRWRYLEHPTHQYACFEARDGDRIRGVAVARAGQTRGLGSGHLVELLAHPTDDEAIDALIDGASAFLTATRPALLRATVGCPSIGARLWRAGFIRAPSPTRLMLATHSGLPPDPIEDIRRWCINSGDSDFDAL